MIVEGKKPNNPKVIELPEGLFNRIILNIEKEERRQRARKTFFSFLFLLILSFIAVPFSWTILVGQVEKLGALYFISTALSDLNLFFNHWQVFSLAVLESIPFFGATLFIISLSLLIFTFRFFLRQRKTLWKQFSHSFKFGH